MMPHTSFASPAAAPLWIRSTPVPSGPSVAVPIVMIVLTPGLFVLMVFNASTTRWRTVALENSVASMSMSIALRLYALMTFWYAPASADADEQCSPSLLPLKPPIDTMTSPPAPRIALIFDWSSPPVSGPLPSHIGVQPPSDRMNGSVNHFTPVPDMTLVGFRVL